MTRKDTSLKVSQQLDSLYGSSIVLHSKNKSGNSTCTPNVVCICGTVKHT